MRSIVLLILILIPPSTTEDLIERLGDRDPFVREEATERLKKLGETARPELLKAATEADPEVAGRVSFLLRILEIRDRLPADVREQFPGLEEEMAAGAGPAWARTLLHASEYDKPSRPLLSFLAPGAVSGAESVPEFLWVTRIVRNHHLTSCESALRARLRHRSSRARGDAAFTLGVLGATKSIPDLLRMTRGNDWEAIYPAWRALIHLLRPDQMELILPLLKQDKGMSLAVAMSIAGRIGATAAIPELERKFRNSDSRVGLKSFAADALCRLGSRDGAAFLMDQSAEGTAVPWQAFNALRMPELWTELRDARITDNGSWTRVQLLESLIHGRRLKFEAPETDDINHALMGHAKSWKGHRFLATVERILENTDHTFILEKDRIRIVDLAEAEAFWKNWWGANR